MNPSSGASTVTVVQFGELVIMSTIRMASGLWAAALKALVSSRITALVVTELLLAAMSSANI